MKELLDAIANSSATQQISLLLKALEYGELGVDFLIECLDNPELEIRAKAYQLLQDVDLEKAKKAISLGLLFNPGDKIYSIYEALIWFTDESYLLFDGVDYLKEIREQVYADFIANHDVLALSLHPLLKRYCTQKELEMAMIKMQQALQISVYLEVMPNPEY